MPVRSTADWRHHREVRHGEVANVVGQHNCAVRTSGSGDERIRRVDRATPFGEGALVAARTPSGFAAGIEETQTFEERVCGPAFIWADSSLDLGDAHAARAEIVPVGEKIEQKRGDCPLSPQMRDQDGGVEEVATQEAGSASERRSWRTQSSVVRRSRHSG